jgi:hypothetical protein
MLLAGDPDGMLNYVSALENYTRPEPLPWAELFAARGRALALTLETPASTPTRNELVRLQTVLLEAGFRNYVTAVNAALAV